MSISMALGWPPDYLSNILIGEADKNVPAESPLEANLAKLAEGIAAGLAEIGALRNDVAGLIEVVHKIDEKLGKMAGARQSPADGP